MLGAAHTKETPTPSSSAGRKWHPVSVVRDRVSIKGGYNTRAESGNCVEFQDGDNTRLFVELDKNAPWFLKGVGGAKVQKGDLKPVCVMQMLRETVEKMESEPEPGIAVAEAVEEDDDAAVAEGVPDTAVAEDATDEVDPMDAMDGMVAVATKPKPTQPTKPTKPKPKKEALSRAVVHELEVPTRPPCAGGDTGDTTCVYVYRRAKSDKRSNSNLFLQTDCLEWLLAYAADELALQGVEAESPEPSPLAGNCPAVADLHLEWDFSAKAWEGKFVAGPLVGTTRCMAVKDLHQGIWERLRGGSLVQGSLAMCRSSIEKKSAAKEWMTMWCAAIARGESTEFDSILAPATPSPPRGEKRPLEDPHHTAVAASPLGPTRCDLEPILSIDLPAAVAGTAVAAPPLDEAAD